MEIEFVDGPLKGEKWKVSKMDAVIAIPELESPPLYLEASSRPRIRNVYYNRLEESNQYGFSMYGEWVGTCMLGEGNPENQ
jgi:hypothetical protein